MAGTVAIHNYGPGATPRPVLLINPPVLDTRFPWSRWHQPVTLLQLSTLLRRYNCDIRLLDALHTGAEGKLTRQRARVMSRGDVKINYWHYGLKREQMLTQLKSMRNEGWSPDEVYIEGFTTYWWPGVREAVHVVREVFPDAVVILCGAYARLATAHAVEHSGADIVVQEGIAGLSGLSLDLSLYSTRPRFAYLSIGNAQRPAEDVVDELVAKTSCADRRMRINHFALADHDVASRFPEQFRSLLEALIERKLRVSLHLLGNIFARDIVANPDVAELLFRAGCRQLVFADDRDLPADEGAQVPFLEAHREAAELCAKAGYEIGSDQLAATLCIGRPGEDIAGTTTFMTQLAHAAGSIIPVPYQPLPGEVGDDPDLIMHNGKLFPFAEQNGTAYRTYQDLLGLAAMLNAKYRQRTFDFLGDGLVSRLVRDSLVTGSWDPTRNGVPDRPITIGYFNREGKWVRS